MRAPMPPKHDLRGGQASADSFAMSRNIFVVSMSRCFFAAQIYELAIVKIVLPRTRARANLHSTGRRAPFSQKVGHSSLRDVETRPLSLSRLGCLHHRTSLNCCVDCHRARRWRSQERKLTWLCVHSSPIYPIRGFGISANTKSQTVHDFPR